MSTATEPRPPDVETGAGAEEAQTVRQKAIEQIERKRKFWTSTIVWGLIMVGVVAIWAVTEYNNAGGWPTDGFSQSSGIAHVWNNWIVYPVGVWILLTAGHAWSVFGRKPITEDEIRREMDRQSGTHR